MNSIISIWTILTTIFVLQNATFISSHRILFLMPLNTRSETHLFNPLAKELANRGHKVTLITSANSGYKNESNLVELNPARSFTALDFMGDITDPLESRKLNANKVSFLLNFNFSFVEQECHKVYKNEQFRKLLDGKEFDLVFTSIFFNECFHGYIHKFRAPLIVFSSMPVDYTGGALMGLRMPPSFIPSSFTAFTDKMSFWERFENTLFTWAIAGMTQMFEGPFVEIYKQYLGENLPSSSEIMENTSLLFSNSHFALNFPRPVLPNIVEVGGIHCRPSKPLQKVSFLVSLILYCK